MFKEIFQFRYNFFALKFQSRNNFNVLTPSGIIAARKFKSKMKSHIK